MAVFIIAVVHKTAKHLFAVIIHPEKRQSFIIPNILDEIV